MDFRWKEAGASSKVETANAEAGQIVTQGIHLSESSKTMSGKRQTSNLNTLLTYTYPSKHIAIPSRLSRFF